MAYDTSHWALQRGTLVIPGTGVEIRAGERADSTFTLYAPQIDGRNAYWTLAAAMSDGEKYANALPFVVRRKV